MSEAVDNVNALLAQFKVVNDNIVRGQGTADDLSDSLDQRESILKRLSEEIGIRVVPRPNNDLLIYAEGGAILFERAPRSVTMQSGGGVAAGAAGAPVLIDGVAVTGRAATMPIMSGRLGALSELRDKTIPQLTQQLDSIAAGLITNFSERDLTQPPALPDAPGLFVDPHSGSLPSMPREGLAQKIAINVRGDPDQGGSPSLIRDGGFGGAQYVTNKSGEEGFQARISQLIASFDQTLQFAEAGGIEESQSILNYSAQSAGWLEGHRKDAQSAADAAAAVKSRANEALLRVTGVNIDEEMASLLDLEKSYQASSKIISVVDAMLSTLFDAVA